MTDPRATAAERRDLPPQSEAPYLAALADYAARRPGRFHVPGHKGGLGADPGLAAAIGETALALDIPSLTWGIDVGVDPTPFQQAQDLAAEAWGARRSWFLINGASQGNQVSCMALAHHGREVVVQRNVHSSTIDGLVLSGLRPTFVAPAIDAELGIAHCITPEALDRALTATPGAVGALAVTPTYFGAVADVAALAAVAHDHGAALVVDEAWGAHMAFSDELPEHALAAGADIVISSTHKIVGSITQSAIVHTGRDGSVDDAIVDRCVTLLESTSPNAYLGASLDAARRFAATEGRERIAATIRAVDATRAAVVELPGLDVLDERIAGRPGVAAYDPLRLAVDVRGTGATGYEIARLMRELHDVNLELAGENVIVAVFGMAEPAAEHGERLVTALRDALARLGRRNDRRREAFAPPPPWGELVMTPREAFLAEQDVVAFEAAAGRVAAESLAAYPPGIPNVLPGERITTDTLDYITRAVEQGGVLRGASDRRVRTLRVVAE